MVLPAFEHRQHTQPGFLPPRPVASCLRGRILVAGGRTDFLSVNVHRKLVRRDVVHVSEFTYCLECTCNPKSTLMHRLSRTDMWDRRRESQPHAAQRGLEERRRLPAPR